MQTVATMAGRSVWVIRSATALDQLCHVGDLFVNSQVWGGNAAVTMRACGSRAPRCLYANCETERVGDCVRTDAAVVQRVCWFIQKVGGSRKSACERLLAWGMDGCGLLVPVSASVSSSCPPSSGVLLSSDWRLCLWHQREAIALLLIC